MQEQVLRAISRLRCSDMGDAGILDHVRLTVQTNFSDANLVCSGLIIDQGDVGPEHFACEPASILDVLGAHVPRLHVTILCMDVEGSPHQCLRVEFNVRDVHGLDPVHHALAANFEVEGNPRVGLVTRCHGYLGLVWILVRCLSTIVPSVIEVEVRFVRIVCGIVNFRGTVEDESMPLAHVSVAIVPVGRPYCHFEYALQEEQRL